MSWMRRLFARRRIYGELSQEIREHLDEKIEELVAAGMSSKEAEAAARFSHLTAWHGIKTHNAIKALHLDEHFGSKAGGCKPGAKIAKLPTKFTRFCCARCHFTIPAGWSR